MIIRWLLVLAGLLYGSGCFAGLVIDGEDFSGEKISAWCEVIIEPVGTHTTDDITSPSQEGAWQSCKEHSLSRGYTQEVLWLRFNFTNNETESRTLYLHFPAPWLSDIRLYTPLPLQGLEESRYGAGLPFKQQIVLSAGFFIPVSLAPQQSHVVYVRAASRGALTAEGKILSVSGMAKTPINNV